MKQLFSLLLLAFVSFGLSQPNIVISPQSIVVNPLPSFNVEVFVDRDPSGTGTPTYQIGDSIQIGVRVSESAYIYLFNVRSNGVVDQILPNRFDQEGQNNFVSAGQTKLFPPSGARYQFTVDGPRGLDKVIAVASKTQLDTRQLADFSRDPNFASSSIGEQGFAETLSIIVTPIDQTSWVTDTALFYVGSAPSTPTYGTLNITSSPSGGMVYVDGQFVGYTPVRFGTVAGSRLVEVRLDGYETYSSRVTLSGGQTLPVQANLQQVRREGRVTFSSSPSGAEVYIGNEYYGTTPTGSFSLVQGTYQARFRLAGHEERTVTFTVSPNSNQTVSGELRALRGSLIVRGNVGGALVFINGNQVATLPSGSGTVTIPDLPSGNHELVVIAPGFRTYLSEFSIRSGETTEMRVQQSRR